jgi:hypothetical protein
VGRKIVNNQRKVKVNVKVTRSEVLQPNKNLFPENPKFKYQNPFPLASKDIAWVKTFYKEVKVEGHWVKVLVPNVRPLNVKIYDRIVKTLSPSFLTHSPSEYLLKVKVIGQCHKVKSLGTKSELS